MDKYLLFVIAVAIAIPLFLRDKNPVMASTELIVNSSVQRVWEIITDLNNWSAWNSDIESMHVQGEIGPGTVFVWKAGGMTIESTIMEFEPETRIAWKGKTFGITAYHVWTFLDKGNQTLIYTNEKFTGLLAWLLPGTMRKVIKKALIHGTEALKKAAEKDSSTKVT